MTAIPFTIQTPPNTPEVRLSGGGAFNFFSEWVAASAPLIFGIFRKGLRFMKRNMNKRAISQGAGDCDGNTFWGGGGVNLPLL